MGGAFDFVFEKRCDGVIPAAAENSLLEESPSVVSSSNDLLSTPPRMSLNLIFFLWVLEVLLTPNIGGHQIWARTTSIY